MQAAIIIRLPSILWEGGEMVSWYFSLGERNRRGKICRQVDRWQVAGTDGTYEVQYKGSQRSSAGGCLVSFSSC